MLSANGVGCRILAALERASVNAVFVCMLIEGVYLHRLIVAVFKKKISERLLYGVGAGWSQNSPISTVMSGC